jgi:hypothetical protein
MEKTKKIPLVYLTIDDDDESGVDFVSLVDEPAIERDFHGVQQRSRNHTSSKLKTKKSA